MEYIDGFVLAVPTANRQAFIDHARMADEVFLEQGAHRIVECWQDDVPTGQQTDFFRTVKAEAGEGIVFAFMEWPSREICDAAAAKMQADERMKMPPDLPFVGQRMVYGGFTPVVELGA